MGHREDLLDGAKRCLLDKGWARTTARDIVAASGANLASIGYHYGSKDALMREALCAVMGDWADDVQQALTAEIGGPGAAVRYETRWARALELFTRHRAMWRAQLEAVLQVERDPELRDAVGRAQPAGRGGLVALFHGIEETDVDEDAARVLGSFYLTLVSGVIMQMVIDPDATPSARDLVEAMRRIVADFPLTAPSD
jgi:AcrR family transcriptional regulator